MQKPYYLFFFLTFMACSGDDQKAPENARAPKPASTSHHSAAFNASFQPLLENYFALTNSLIAGNDSLAAKFGTSLANRSDSVKLSELKADTTIYETAQAILASVKSESIGLSGEKNIESRRKSYQMVSDAMYDLVRTLKYDNQTLYHQFCPMAFNEQGAYWLSNSPEIQNPYFGNKMLNCGETKDSLAYGAR